MIMRRMIRDTLKNFTGPPHLPRGRASMRLTAMVLFGAAISGGIQGAEKADRSGKDPLTVHEGSMSGALRQAREKLATAPESGTVRRAALDWAMMECRRLQDTGGDQRHLIDGLAKDVLLSLANPSLWKKG